MSEPAWSARCDCYNDHYSASGRCSARATNGQRGITDPTRFEGQKAICEDCRNKCPCGKGERNEA